MWHWTGWHFSINFFLHSARYLPARLRAYRYEGQAQDNETQPCPIHVKRIAAIWTNTCFPHNSLLTSSEIIRICLELMVERQGFANRWLASLVSSLCLLAGWALTIHSIKHPVWLWRELEIPEDVVYNILLCFNVWPIAVTFLKWDTPRRTARKLRLALFLIYFFVDRT